MPSHPVHAGPRFRTRIVTVDSGDEQTNPVWEHTLQRYSMPETIRDFETYAAVRAHWYAMDGPAYTWPFRDPLDYSSIDHIFDPAGEDPVISATDQLIGIGDGITTEFQIVRNYTSGAYTHSRPLYLPVVATVTVAVDGVQLLVSELWNISGSYAAGDQVYYEGVNYYCTVGHTAGIANWPGSGSQWQDFWVIGGGPFTVSRPGGIITLDEPPAEGAEITCGYLFDVEVRFENDESFVGVFAHPGHGGYATINLVEVRHCSDSE